MKTETAISAAAARAGMNMTETRLRGIVDDMFKKFHGNAERALPAFWRAIRDDAEAGQLAVSPYLRRVFDDKNGVDKLKCANLDRGGVGPAISGGQAISARPGREPSDEDRAAGLRAMDRLKLTVYDTFKVRDGRGIGDVRWGQLASLEGADMLSAAVIRRLMKHTQAPHDMTVREAVKVRDLRRIVSEAREEINVK